MAAARALTLGEWEKCRDLMTAIKIWNLFPEHSRIKTMLEVKIKEEALRTYLFTYAPHYDSMSLDQLMSMFTISSTAITSLISKMIISEELYASLDQSTNTLTITKGTQVSRLEYLAAVYSDKLSSLVEQNEHALENSVRETNKAHHLLNGPQQPNSQSGDGKQQQQRKDFRNKFGQQNGVGSFPGLGGVAVGPMGRRNVNGGNRRGGSAGGNRRGGQRNGQQKRGGGPSSTGAGR